MRKCRRWVGRSTCHALCGTGSLTRSGGPRGRSVSCHPGLLRCFAPPDRVRDPVPHMGNASFGFKKEGGEWWQRQAHRVGASVRRLRFGVDAAHVAHAAAKIFLGVTVKKLPPESARGHADTVPQARYRGEVANDQDFIAGRSAFAEQRDNTGGGVIAVYPLKAGGIGVKLVQGWLLAIHPVQLLNPVLHAAVHWILQDMP